MPDVLEIATDTSDLMSFREGGVHKHQFGHHDGAVSYWNRLGWELRHVNVHRCLSSTRGTGRRPGLLGNLVGVWRYDVFRPDGALYGTEPNFGAALRTAVNGMMEWRP